MLYKIFLCPPFFLGFIFSLWTVPKETNQKICFHFAVLFRGARYGFLLVEGGGEEGMKDSLLQRAEEFRGCALGRAVREVEDYGEVESEKG